MSQNNEKVAFFDFCETIANFQTADSYVRYVQSHSKPTNTFIRSLYNVLNKSRVLGVLRRLFPKNSIDKRFILRQMKGRTYEEMDCLAKNFYEYEVKPNLIDSIVERLKEMQGDGYEIVIVSGGYDIYLKYFAQDYCIKHVLSTSIGFENGICTGMFEGKDCMFDNKIDYINSLFDGNRTNWFAFSDSVTDLPMLLLVGNPIVVSKSKSQKWAEKKDIKQIIWNKI